MPVFVTEFLWHFLFILLHTLALISLFVFIFCFFLPFISCYISTFIYQQYFYCLLIHLFFLTIWLFLYLSSFVHHHFASNNVYFSFLFLILYYQRVPIPEYTFSVNSYSPYDLYSPNTYISHLLRTLKDPQSFVKIFAILKQADTRVNDSLRVPKNDTKVYLKAWDSGNNGYISLLPNMSLINFAGSFDEG